MRKLFKPLIAALVAIVITTVPHPQAYAGDGVPVVKTQLAAVTVPWGTAIPAADDFKTFQCGNRIFLVWQEKRPGGGKDERTSRLYALRETGVAVSGYWQVMGVDSADATIRFPGTCVGNRAVLVNRWRDPAGKTAGEMATSVTGEEKTGPTWTPDGTTIYHWYRTDEKPAGTTEAFHIRALETGKLGTVIASRVLKSADAIAGASVNYVLESDGRATVNYAPWYRDLSKLTVAAGTVHETQFLRIAGSWRVYEWDVPATSGDPVARPADMAGMIRTDGESMYHPRPIAEARCEVARIEKNALMVAPDGLHFRPWGACDASGTMLQGNDLLLHSATASGTEPRIYITESVTGSSTGQAFVYAVRSGDGRIQIWRGVVK